LRLLHLHTSLYEQGPFRARSQASLFRNTQVYGVSLGFSEKTERTSNMITVRKFVRHAKNLTVLRREKNCQLVFLTNWINSRRHFICREDSRSKVLHSHRQISDFL